MPTNQLNKAILEEASKYIGILEATGNNDGPEIEEFQRVLGPFMAKQPWCLDFVHYVVDKVCKKYELNHPLYQTHSCILFWEKTPSIKKRKYPEPGFICIEQHGDTRRGHARFVKEVLETGAFKTIEGNALDPKTGNQGVFSLTRKAGLVGDKRILGFVDAFAQ